MLLSLAVTRESLSHAYLRVRRDLTLNAVFPAACRRPGEVDGDGASLPWWPWPCLPAAWSPRSPPVGTGSRGTSVSARQRSAAAEGELWFLAVGIESRVPARRCTLPSHGASLGGSSLHPTEQTSLCGLPGAWEPRHPEASALGGLCSKINRICLKITGSCPVFLQ